jgi:hypothetical protein
MVPIAVTAEVAMSLSIAAIPETAATQRAVVIRKGAATPRAAEIQAVAEIRVAVGTRKDAAQTRQAAV